MGLVLAIAIIILVTGGVFFGIRYIQNMVVDVPRVALVSLTPDRGEVYLELDVRQRVEEENRVEEEEVKQGFQLKVSGIVHLDLGPWTIGIPFSKTTTIPETLLPPEEVLPEIPIIPEEVPPEKTPIVPEEVPEIVPIPEGVPQT